MAEGERLMAGVKELINRTGNELKVTLIVRKGDSPSKTAGTVEVDLGPEQTGDDRGTDDSHKTVAYGDDTNIYLNGFEVQMIVNGSAVGEKRITVDRGSDLDNALNTHDTIEFLYDGKSILISATNSAVRPFSFQAEIPDDNG